MIIIYILIILFFIIFIINLVFNFIIIKKKYSIINEKSEDDKKDFFKIIHLSDIHGIKTKYKKNKILKIIIEENPNIIAITGDLIDSTDYAKGKFPIEKTTDFMKEMLNFAPVYYVFGNHELALMEDKTEKAYEFLKTIEEAGIKIVNNEIDKIQIEDEEIEIMGIQDPQTVNSYDPFDKTIEEELRFVTRGINEKAYKVLLVHRPEYFNLYSEYNIDLCLSGHAHGGQFRFPFIKGLYAPNQGWFPKYTKGEYEMNNTKMIVSPGLGNSVFKLRIFNPFEVGIISIEK